MGYPAHFPVPCHTCGEPVGEADYFRVEEADGRLRWHGCTACFLEREEADQLQRQARDGTLKRHFEYRHQQN